MRFLSCAVRLARLRRVNPHLTAKTIFLPIILFAILIMQSSVVGSSLPGRGPMIVRTDGVLTTWTAGDTVNILAIRVEFQPDDFTTTTGNGTFGTGFPDTMVIDPLPHDKQYFEDHLLFVKNYFDVISNHHLKFGRMDVYPTDPSGSYRLPYQMWHYNYNYTSEVLDQQLADLFFHSWLKADSAGLFDSVNVNNYNAFVIFHAGVGKDFAFGYDSTPFDIPSAFLNLEHLTTHLAIPDSGIPVHGGYIPYGLILPESEVQEGYELGLNGVMSKLFANMIGIPDLYDTQTGRSGIGRWGMMDQGSGNYNALIPSRPDPWTAFDMGWMEPMVLHPGAPDTLSIASITVADTAIPKCYQVPINDHEYFLIENRQRNIGGLNYTSGWDRDNREIRFYDDYSIATQSGFRVIVRVDDYDFDIPGSGILIWHIDESVINAHRADNTVNASRPYRGVDVEEADGCEDIGQEYGLFDAGYGQEYGSPWDCFYEDNEVHLESNHSTQVRFTDYTAPWTRSNSGALSHLSFTRFSTIDTIMTFVLTHSFHQNGFPISIGHGIVPNSELPVDLTGDGIDELVVMDNSGRLLGFRGDGTGLGILGDGVLARLSPPDSGMFKTAASDLDGDGIPEIVVTNPDSTWIFTATDSSHIELVNRWVNGGIPLIGGTSDNRLVFVATGSDVMVGDANGILRWRGGYPFGIIQGMALYEDSVSVVSVYSLSKVALIRYDTLLAYGTLVASDSLPVPSGSLTTAPVVGNLDGLNKKVVVASSEGIFIGDFGSFAGPFPTTMPVAISSPPSLADINHDGELEVVLSGHGAIYTLYPNGALVSGFPIQDAGWLGQDFSGAPVLVGDLTSADTQNLLLMGPLGNLVAFNVNGNRVEGFPLSVGTSDGRAPMLAQLDSDAAPELIMGSATGIIYGWNLETGAGAGNYMPWSIWGGNPARTNYAIPSPYSIPTAGGALPSNWTYCWPNPSNGNQSFIRVSLTYSAEVQIRIFDMAGELVDELRNHAEPFIPIDVAWQLNNVQSGVYFARVKTQGGNRSDTKILKVAVIK